MKNKSKVIAGIVTLMILLISTTTVSTAVFSGLENEEIWTNAGTTTTKPSHLFLLVAIIFLIVTLAIGIIVNYCLDNKEMVVGHVIAESCAMISLMFLIVRIAILDLLFAILASAIIIILLGLALHCPQKYFSYKIQRE